MVDHRPGCCLLQRRNRTNRRTGGNFTVHAKPAHKPLIVALYDGVSLVGKTVLEKVGTSGRQMIAFLAGLIAGSTADATCNVEQEALLDDGHRSNLQISSTPSLVLRIATIPPKTASLGDLRMPLQSIEFMHA
jgi:hypothetical protein